MSSWWKKATKSITKVANDAGKAITNTTNTVVNDTTKVINDAGKAITDTANQVADDVTKTANQVADEVNKLSKSTELWVNSNIIKPLNNEVIKPTVEEVKAVSNQVASEATKIGYQVGDDFNQGLKACEDVAIQGTQAVVQGAVELGEYLEENACNIFVGGALLGAFAGANATPEKAAEDAELVAMTAAAMAAGVLETAAMKGVCYSLGLILIEPLWAIPDVKRAFSGDKKTATDTLGAIIFFFACYTPKTIIATGGTVIDGIICWMLTSLICTGKMPKALLDMAKQAA